jgi:RimJ/RimL family protein N-acetyltransferase
MYDGQRVSLQPFTPDQSRQYLEWVNDSAVAMAVTRALPVSPLEHQRWYESAVTRSDAVFFSVVTRETQEYVGNVWLWGVHSVHRSAELRILLGSPTARGRGYGSESCELLLDFAFRHLNLNKVYLYVLESNVAARRTFEKAGFRQEGLLTGEFYVDGRYQNALRMAAFQA